ncbi:MAG: tetratricopeptide repeat protein [Pseudomonadota bacterium]
MSELFDEIDEDVRRDQLKKIWDKYSILIIAGAILIIAAVGGWRGYQYLEAKKAAEAGAAFDKASELSEQNKHTEAEAAFADLAAKAPAGYRTLARLRVAAEAASRDPQAAAKLYDEIAADRSVGAPEQDLARVRAAGLLLETAAYSDMLQRLEPATAPGTTFRHTARELLALSAWRANDTAAARRWLDVIANDGETPASLRSRAEALQALLPPVAKS